MFLNVINPNQITQESINNDINTFVFKLTCVMVSGKDHCKKIKSKRYKDIQLFALLPVNLLSEKVPSHKRSSFLVLVCVLRSHSSGRAVALE